MKFFYGNAAKWASWWLCIFLRGTAREGGSTFLRGYNLHRNYAMVVIKIKTLKLHQEKCSYPNEGQTFIGRFKLGRVPGVSVALEASKKVSKCIMTMIQDH